MVRISLFQPQGQDMIVIHGCTQPNGRRLPFRREILPGGSYRGWTYEELKALGNRIFDLEPRPPVPSLPSAAG